MQLFLFDSAAAIATAATTATLVFLVGTTTTTTTTKVVNAFDYSPNVAGATQNLVDVATEIDGLRTIFINDVTKVYIEGVEWSPNTSKDKNDNSTGTGTTSMMQWKTSVNGVVQDSGSVDLSNVNRELPTSFAAGQILVDQKQTSIVTVTVSMDETTSTSTNSYQTYSRGISLIPLLFIFVMALTTRMVEISLFLGVLLGCCIVTGSLNEGFKICCSEFLVNALADEDHVYIILFVVFLSGIVGLLEKSGGMLGFTRDVSKVATTPRTGQFACMSVGILIFFDDYASVLLAGETMRPLLDLLSVSREKLSFIVDATSAPIASVSPISSWVGFEVSLIQNAITVIEERLEGTDEVIKIPTQGFAVFLQSIKYSYYSWFMLVLVALLITFQRDFGPMLIAERKVRVYDRTDGGPGSASTKGEGGSGEMIGDDENQPVEDQPLLGHNLLIPVAILVTLIFALLVETGTIDEEEQSFMNKLENSDSYAALLWGTMATAWLSLILYLLQITIPGTGKLCWPTPARLYDMMPWRKTAVEERSELQPRFLLSVGESVEGFLYGMGRIFLAIVVLTLAWASGAIMETIGVDRLFASIIVSGVIPFQFLPMLTFIIAMLMAMATGTSFGTMAILYPLILVPAYFASDGSPEIFYATTSAVLGGAVAGDHVSPISDTTVISALACDVTLMQHVVTQAPYVFVVVIFAIVFGYIPMGYDAYPNFVGILLGWASIFLYVYLFCVPIIHPTGRWDPITTLLFSRTDELQTLQDDCIKKSNGETLIGEDDSNNDSNANEPKNLGEKSAIVDAKDNDDVKAEVVSGSESEDESA